MTQYSYRFLLFLMITFVALTGCGDEGGDPTADALNQELTKLMNEGSSWVLGTSGSVMKDGYDVTDQFDGFTLTIGNKTFTTSNSLTHVWETSGTWDFQNSNPSKVLRDDGVVISVSHTSTQLILTFSTEGKSSERAQSIAGEYEFHLVSE